MSRSVDDQDVPTPFPVRELSRAVSVGPGRLAALPVILVGVIVAAWLGFDALLDQRQSPHTTIVTLAGVVALLAVIATLVSLLGLRSTTFLWIAAAGFASTAALSLAGHLTLMSATGALSLPRVLLQIGALLLVAGPPSLAGLALAYVCRRLARTTRWSPPG